MKIKYYDKLTIYFVVECQHYKTKIITLLG